MVPLLVRRPGEQEFSSSLLSLKHDFASLYHVPCSASGRQSQAFHAPSRSRHLSLNRLLVLCPFRDGVTGTAFAISILAFKPPNVLGLLPGVELALALVN